MKRKTFRTSWIALLVLAMVFAVNAMAPANGMAAPAMTPDAGQNNLPRTQFSLSNFNGRYSFLNYVAGLAASLGTMTFDGNGNIVDGTAVGNTIAISGGQIVSDTFNFTFSGTYTVDMNGNGHVRLVANLPGGHTQESNFDFVVLEVQKVNGKVLATELRAVQVEREPNTHQIGQVIVKRLSD